MKYIKLSAACYDFVAEILKALENIFWCKGNFDNALWMFSLQLNFLCAVHWKYVALLRYHNQRSHQYSSTINSTLPSQRYGILHHITSICREEEKKRQQIFFKTFSLLESKEDKKPEK